MDYSLEMLNALVLIGNYILIPTLAYGSQLTLGALGVTLTFGILRFSNFAHAELMGFGTMITIFVTWYLQNAGIGIAPLPTALLALPIGIISTIALVLVMDRVTFYHYRKIKSKPLIFMIVSIGLMFFIGGIVRLLIGGKDQVFVDGVRFIFSAREFKKFSGLSEGLAFKVSQGVTIVVTFIAVIALFAFLNRTRFGKAMRAYADNENLALLSGINPERVVMITWVITAILAVLAGVLYGLDKSFKPFIYMQFLLPIFASAIVGGFGSPLGAIAGGYLIAFSEIAVTFVYKKFFTYLLPATWAPGDLWQILTTEYKFAVSFIILVIVLLIRPQGIFKGKEG